MTLEIGNPIFTKNISGYSFSWPQNDITVSVERLNDDGIGELAFYHENHTGTRLLHIAKANLLSTPTLTQLAKRMKENIDLDWTSILTYVTSISLEQLRQGEPLQNINCSPQSMKLDYLLYPILIRDEPTTIYAPG